MLQTLPPAALTRLNLLRGAAPTADRLFIAALAAFFLAAAPAPGGGQGFPNVERTAGELISGLNAPEQGRTAIIAYHHGVLYTIPESPSSVPPFDVQVRSWDLSDPADPQVLQLLGATTHPFDAHGYFKSGDYLVIGPNSPPEAPWSFRADGPAGTLERTTFPGLVPPVGRGAVFQPWSVNPTLWSYDAVGGSTSLFKDGQTLATWDHLGLTGVIGHPFILGDLLIFASDQSRTGVATYDIGDPANPVLLDVLTAGGAGGYWPEIWGGDGKLYVVFPYRTDGNGVRVVDATDPSDLAFIADVPLPGDEAMYAQFQDHYAFIGDHKVNLRTMQSVLFLDGLNTPRPDGGVGVSTSQFALPLGNLLITGGVGEFQGMAIWAHQDAPDSEGPTVGFHVPRDGAANYPLGSPISLLIHETLETPTIQNGVSFIVRPVGGQPISGRLSFSFDDVLTFTPDADLLPDTTYEVVLPDGGIEDAAGNGIEGYSFTFSTGSTVGGNGAPQLTGFAVTPYPALPGETANFTATAADPDGDGVEYRFDFGDGSPGTAWGAAAAAEHTYAAEGHYRATVQARDPSGALSTRAVTVTVRTPPAGPPPPRSTPVACHGAARRGYKVNPDNDTLTAFDLDTRAVVFEVPTCRDPRSVARAHTGELWVACHGGDAVRVHGADGAAVAELGTGYGSAPFGLVAAPSGEVYVSLYGTGEIRRYDAAARQDTGSLPVGPTPRALALTPDGARLFVSRFLSLENRAEIWEVDTAGFTVARTLWIRKFGGAEHRDGTANGRGTANYLAGLAVDPLGRELWVASTKPNTERGLLFGPELDSDNTMRTVVTRLDVSTGAVLGDIDLDNSDSASAIAFSPLGDYVVAALQGNDDVVVLDALRVGGASGLGSLVGRLGAGAAPQGICVDRVTRRTVVANFLGRSVDVLETDGLLRRGDIQVSSLEVPTVAAESLDPEVLLGKRLFYFAGDARMSAEGYLSCASCHLDGGHDGRTWDFTGRGEGLRNTTDLRGRGGLDHGLVHWTANFDEIQDFENDIRRAFGGVGFLDDADFADTEAPLGAAKAGLSPELDALEAYVGSLARGSIPKSPFRQPSGALTSDAVAGELRFTELGCASCHGGRRLTDSPVDGGVILHDVGTLRTTSGDRLGGPLPGLDTPTLRGLWAGAPYFHDGSARDLAEVFTEAGGELLPAETGAPSGGAFIMADPVGAFLNYDDTLRGRGLADLSPNGATLTFTGVDGGPGGLGALELRHSSTAATAVDISVNGGAPRTVSLPNPFNQPNYRHTLWEVTRVEDVDLLPGPVNTIAIVGSAQFPNLSLDDLTVTSAADRTAADAHRRVDVLDPQARAELIAFLLQLDGSTVPSLEGGIFADGFESGDLSAWSGVFE